MKSNKEQFENIISSKTLKIKAAMAQLGSQLENNDEKKLLYWVIPKKLCCAHRPLRHHPLYGGSRRNLDKSATLLVIEWAKKIKDSNIRSIISLMHDKDLQSYDNLDLNASDLLEFYKNLGFTVSHIPWEDPHHKKSSQEEKQKKLFEIRERALIEYSKLPKPVLLQCSAGIDRSSPVAAFIWAKTLNNNSSLINRH